MCMLWHVEFLNEQECVHKRLSSLLHLGTLHVFVQMISLACRQPNYLSSSVSSEPKRTSTHRSIHIPQGCLSATLLPHCVMEAITLLPSTGNVEHGKTRPAPGYTVKVIFTIIPTHWLLIWTLFFVTISKNPMVSFHMLTQQVKLLLRSLAFSNQHIWHYRH